MATDKDTIYIDIDDEITGIIDKVRSSDGRVVALVLPKRASVFQSIVNMKLLKRAAGDAKKSLVLITSESGLMPLAGAAGIHVASNLSSKPQIPSGPDAPSDIEETVEEINDDLDEVTTETAGSVPVGALADMPSEKASAKKNDDMETVELDNEEPEEKNVPAPVAAPKLKKDKKLAVPNFERFRMLLIFGGIALVLLIIGMVVAMKVLPKAVIAIDTDATSVSVEQPIKLSTSAQSVHLTDNTLPAKLSKQTKTYTEQVKATGQENHGDKAAGQVTMTACTTTPLTVPAGTGVSANGKTYITQSDASLTNPSGFCPGGGAKVSSTVNITAQSGGADYNVSSGTSFKVSGYTSVSATGSATGGTDDLVTVVSASDIDAAKGKINTSDPSVKKTLEDDLKSDNYFAINATFNAGTPVSKSSANVGDEASTVTVTVTVSYTMFGVQKEDLKDVIEHAAKEQIDTAKQSILDDGVSAAVFAVDSQDDKGANLTLHTAVSAGPQLDTEAIKQEAAGKKSGEVKDTIKQNPDVTDVNIKLSPFWVSSIPSNTSKITVNVAKPKPSSNSSNAN